MLFLLTPFLFISIFLDCFSLVQRSFLRSVVRKLVRSTIFCSSFLPYHIFSFFHVLHWLRIHSFFEYNKSLCENVGSARSVDRNSKIIIIINGLLPTPELALFRRLYLTLDTIVSSKVGGIARAPVWGANHFLQIIAEVATTTS